MVASKRSPCAIQSVACSQISPTMYSVGVHRSHPSSKPLPEARRGDLGGHVEPPPVDAPRRPVLAHRIEVVDHLGIGRVELGESM